MNGHEGNESRRLPRDAQLDDLFDLIRGLDKKVDNIQKEYLDITGSVNALSTAIIKHGIDLHEHIQNEENVLKKHTCELERLSLLVKAFPKIKETGEPDIYGHHDYHVGLIESSNQWQRMLARIKTSILTDLVKGVLLIAGLVIALGIRDFIYHPEMPSQIEHQIINPLSGKSIPFP